MTSTPDLEALLEHLEAETQYAAAAAIRELRGFQDAVIDALVIAHIYQKAHDTDPRKALHDLLSWETEVALDPAVSSSAEKLRDTYLAERDYLRAELATAQRRLLETQTSGQTRYMIEADQLRAELERATVAHDLYGFQLRDCRAELEAAKKDAERYRWRRTHTKWNITPEQFDKITDLQMNDPAIDAVLAQHPEKL